MSSAAADTLGAPASPQRPAGSCRHSAHEDLRANRRGTRFGRIEPPAVLPVPVPVPVPFSREPDSCREPPSREAARSPRSSGIEQEDRKTGRLFISSSCLPVFLLHFPAGGRREALRVSAWNPVPV